MHERDQAPNAKLREELERDQRTSRTTGAEGVAHALQRSAGNRSVSALLAREPEPQKAEEKPKAAAAAGLATLSEIGAIPLNSVTLPGSPSGGTGSGGAGGSRERPVTREVSFTSSTGEHSPKLFRAVSDGTQMTADVLMGGGVHLTLTGAMVSGYQVSGSGDNPMESWSLNFEAWTWK